MALNLNIDEEGEIRNFGFKTALFIDVPNWEKDKINKKQNNEIISAGNTPDKNKLNEFNKSLISNLISRDLLKKLEEESPSKFDQEPFFDNYFDNQHFYGSKLSLDEEDLEDSDTKISKQTKLSTNSNYNSSSEKMNERKSNSIHLLFGSNCKECNEFSKKYPSSMDNYQQFYKSKEDQDLHYKTHLSNNENFNSNSNSKKIRYKYKITLSFNFNYL
jgi:hypothetical protein